MRIIFELNHPKHYYQFKYVIQMLQSAGDEVLVLARDKDVLLNVLAEEKIPFSVFGKHKDSLCGKLFSSASIMNSYIRIAKEFKPDIIVSKASLYGTLTAKLLRKTSIIFPDSEVVALTNKIVAPMATCIITPEPFMLNFGEKHHKIKGLFEDCYLSPTVLSINNNAPEEFGLNRPYAILRFVGWSANHDINNNGFSLDQKIELAKQISKYMTVYISSEKKLPSELASYQLNTPAAKIHDVLAGASLYVGDSQTMATEAALLGTPAIRSNSFVGEHDMSNFKMLESKYKLLMNIKDFDKVLEAAISLAKNPRKEEWTAKRNDYYRTIGDPNLSIVNIIKSL